MPALLSTAAAERPPIPLPITIASHSCFVAISALNTKKRYEKLTQLGLE